MRRPLITAVAALITLAVATGRAQPPEPAQEQPSGETESPDEARARELYGAGTKAAAAGQWADALRRFDASYALVDNPAALFNKAVALRGLGRHREARDAFVLLLQQHADLPEPMRAQALQMQQEEAGRVSVVVVQTYANCRLFADGQPVGLTALPLREVELDPGPHRMRAECPAREPVSKQVQLVGGRRVDITLQPPSRAEPEPIVIPPPSPAPIALIVAGATVAAAGIVIGAIGIDGRLTVENAEEGTPWTDVEGAHDRSEVMIVVGPVLLGVGLASLVAGVSWMQLREESPDDVSLELAPLPFGAALRGRF